MIKFFKSKQDVSAKFTKGPREEIVTVRFENGTLTTRQTTKFDEIMESISTASSSCADVNTNEFGACIAQSVVDQIDSIVESKQILLKYRDNVAERLRNYTCADTSLKTTESVTTYPIELDNGRKLRAEVLLDEPASKIWYINNFITKAECDVLINHGRPLLHRATVAAEDGTSVVSENRKANQASYDRHEHDENDPLWYVCIVYHHFMLIIIRSYDHTIMHQYIID